MAFRIVVNNRTLVEDIATAALAAMLAQEHITDFNTVKVENMDTGKTIKIWKNGHTA
jgi:hypothetical protein